MGKRKCFLLAVLTLLYVPSFLSADLETFGYYQNRFFLFYNKESGSRALDKKFNLGDYNRFRLQFLSSVAENISVNLAVDFFTFHGSIKSPLGVYESPDNKDDILASLDRAHVDFYLPNFDIIVGKQRLSFGVSRFWTPIDIFNRVNVFDPSEEKPGVNALKMYIPMGNTSNLTAVFAPERKFSTSRSGFRFQSMIKGIDIGFNFFHHGERHQNIYGIDLRGENFFGWWVEAGYFTSSAGNKTKIVLGMDYTFPILSGLFWQNEFFYDESGEKNPSLYEFESLHCGDRYTLGRTYFLSKMHMPLAKFLIGSMIYIGNWTDGSCTLNPEIQYSIAQNVSLNTGFFFSLGSSEGEFNRRENSNIFYIWLKTSF
jgi:hypothetical protein